MKSAREWVHEKDWEDLQELVERVQADALEAAALVCRAHPEDSEWDGYGESFAEDIHKLKPKGGE